MVYTGQGRGESKGLSFLEHVLNVACNVHMYILNFCKTVHCVHVVFFHTLKVGPFLVVRTVNVSFSLNVTYACMHVCMRFIVEYSICVYSNFTVVVVEKL